MWIVFYKSAWGSAYHVVWMNNKCLCLLPCVCQIWETAADSAIYSHQITKNKNILYYFLTMWTQNSRNIIQFFFPVIVPGIKLMQCICHCPLLHNILLLKLNLIIFQEYWVFIWKHTPYFKREMFTISLELKILIIHSEISRFMTLCWR